MPSRKGIRDLSTFLFALLTSSQALAQQPKEIRLTATEYSFKPAKIQGPLGEVKIVVTNRGRFPHSLALADREEKISYIESGETKSLVVKFDKEEDLIFYCSQPGHRGKGMEGKLTVGKK